MMAPETHQKASGLLSAYLDGELTQSEHQLVRLHLEECAECRQALSEMTALQAAARELAFPEPPDDRLDAIERSIAVQAPRRLGWVLLVIGVLMAVIWGTAAYIRSRESCGWLDLIVGLSVAGFLLLFFSVLRQRLLALPHDRYRRIER